MKKVFFITLAALTLAACGEQSKAEHKAKAYLNGLSNAGDVEIVECGAIEDYVDTYDPACLIKGDIDLALREGESQLSLFYELGDSSFLAASREALERAKTLQAELDTVKAVEYNIKRMRVSFRASNALGAKVKDDVTLYFSPDLEQVSLKSCDVR